MQWRDAIDRLHRTRESARERTESALARDAIELCANRPALPEQVMTRIEDGEASLQTDLFVGAGKTHEHERNRTRMSEVASSRSQNLDPTFVF